jgi:hypothetical protein
MWSARCWQNERPQVPYYPPPLCAIPYCMHAVDERSLPAHCRSYSPAQRPRRSRGSVWHGGPRRRGTGVSGCARCSPLREICTRAAPARSGAVLVQVLVLVVEATQCTQRSTLASTSASAAIGIGIGVLPRHGRAYRSRNVESLSSVRRRPAPARPAPRAQLARATHTRLASLSPAPPMSPHGYFPAMGVQPPSFLIDRHSTCPSDPALGTVARRWESVIPDSCASRE